MTLLDFDGAQTVDDTASTNDKQRFYRARGDLPILPKSRVWSAGLRSPAGQAIPASLASTNEASAPSPTSSRRHEPREETKYCLLLHRRPRAPRHRGLQRLAQTRQPHPGDRQARRRWHALRKLLLHQFDLRSFARRHHEWQAQPHQRLHEQREQLRLEPTNLSQNPSSGRLPHRSLRQVPPQR